MPVRHAITAIALVLASTAAALSHPVPKTAIPAPKAILAASPTEIRIGFSERLLPAFSGLELRDARDHAVGLGPSTISPENDKELFAAIKVPLGPGVYKVLWHAVGDDTHRVKGSYSFEVKP